MTVLLKLLVIVFCTTNVVFAQQGNIKYWIQFTDKNNSSYSQENPAQFLSQKAINRRLKNHIPITIQDLPVNETYINSVASFPSVSILNPSKWFNAITINCSDTNDLNEIVQLPFVKKIEIVQKLQLNNGSNSIENKFDAIEKDKIEVLTNVHYPYGVSYDQIHLHKLDFLHDLGFNGNGMTIAVIDAGFKNVQEMTCFKHLFQENRILSTKDFVDHDGDVYEDHFHGTAVLSTMAAKVDGDYFGTATLASFHLLRSEDAAIENIVEEDNWVTAAEYADSVGADIINSSLGYTTFDDSLQNHNYLDLDGNTTRIAQAADFATSKGILVVASAGNSGADTWRYISTPADADSILTVGAVDSLGNYAFFSSVGPSSDGDVKPNVASVGYGTYLFIPESENAVKGNGTSFSSPMMAGMAACLWQALPELNNMEIIDLIQKSSNQSNSPDSLLGYGIPNFEKAYSSIKGNKDTISEFEIISLYPNPMEGNQFKIVVRCRFALATKIEITNSFGQTLYAGETFLSSGKNQVSINNFNVGNGMYFLKLITNSEGNLVRKFIVN